MISTASMRFCATFRVRFSKAGSIWPSETPVRMRESVREPAGRQMNPFRRVANFREIGPRCSSRFLSMRSAHLNCGGYTGACGFHHARRIAKNSKKEKSFLPFSERNCASLFAYSTSDQPRSDRSTGPATPRRYFRHASRNGTPKDKGAARSSGRPPLFHSRSAFSNLGYCLLSLPQ
jgi:hypothetical protein